MVGNLVKQERHGSVLVLTISREDALNALNLAVLGELHEVVESIRTDSAVSVVVLTGAGKKAFVAGADIKEICDMNSLQIMEFSRMGRLALGGLQSLDKPVIGAVNGFALGGGLELALACDFLYASDRAKFGLPEALLGVIPGFGGTQTLARAIGASRAREMLYTGKSISAVQARDWGLVNEVFPAETLMESTLETAQTIAQNGSIAIAMDKRAVRQGQQVGLEDGIMYERALFGNVFSTADQREGMRAFIEKRSPQFSGS